MTDSSPDSFDTEPLPSSARAIALRVLSDLRPGRHTARDLLERALKKGDPAPRERALAQELVMGVLRHRLTLARVLDQFAGRGFKRIDPRLQQILMLGAYQLVWLDGIPAFAAVAEAVEQAKRNRGPRAGKFVNALLRDLHRGIENLRVSAEGADPCRAVPVDGGRCCLFRAPLLPDPTSEPVEYLSLATSHPAWLVSRWLKGFGWDRTREICLAGLGRPPVTIRPNPLRIDLAGLADRLAGEGLEVISDPEGGVLVVTQATALFRTRAYAEGLFQAQDRTAMGVVRQMNPQPGQCVIDLCAGPGTKTTQLAEAMADTGQILASDKDDGRLAPVRTNCARLGLTCVRTVLPGDLEATAAALPKIDWILVDAPCSNTGVLARRPEARYRLKKQDIESLADLQFELLTTAQRLARTKTRLAYSTCSLETEENEAVTARFTQVFPRWRLEASSRAFPQADSPEAWRDGGYWAILSQE